MIDRYICILEFDNSSQVKVRKKDSVNTFLNIGLKISHSKMEDASQKIIFDIFPQQRARFVNKGHSPNCFFSIQYLMQI